MEMGTGNKEKSVIYKNMISACILTFNEEHNLQGAIDSIKSGVSEIVVIDGFSTDKTLDICKKNNLPVYQRLLEGNYGAQRNFAISKAKNDWIFMLDADERCSPALSQSLAGLCKSKAFDGYSFIWNNYADERFVEALFKTVLFKRYGYYIHEVHEKVQGLKNIKQINDKKIYIDHRKSVQVQEKHLRIYKQIILDNLKKYKLSGDKEKIAYYEKQLEKQKRKEKLWLNSNL